MSQKQRLLDYLLGGNTVDRMDALNILGIFELSRAVTDLEKEGHTILKKTKKLTN